MNLEMQRALEADGEKLRALSCQDHGPHFVAPLHVIGVIRDRGLGDAALSVWLSEPISEAELREFCEYVNKWRPTGR